MLTGVFFGEFFFFVTDREIGCSIATFDTIPVFRVADFSTEGEEPTDENAELLLKRNSAVMRPPLMVRLVCLYKSDLMLALYTGEPMVLRIQNPLLNFALMLKDVHRRDECLRFFNFFVDIQSVLFPLLRWGGLAERVAFGKKSFPGFEKFETEAGEARNGANLEKLVHRKQQLDRGE